MTGSFNLVDREWIPCVTPDGRVVHTGLLAALTGAKQFKEVRDESPLVTVSLHRLLLAVLHRIFGPETPDAWAHLWHGGRGEFDVGKLEAYLKSPSVSPRFDLFDTKHPFYQTAALPLGDPDKKNMGRPKFVKPVWQMAHELAYSDSMNLFAHFKETDWEIRPAAEAARWLIAFQAFALGGLITTEEGKKAQDGSADAGQLVKSAVVLAKGDSLFQTLMLNLVHYSAEEGVPFKHTRDKPAWERDEAVRPADRPFDGYLDLLTWQSRRVKLVPELSADGELLGVSGVVAMKGWQLPGFNRYDRETMVGFVKAEKVQTGQDPWPPLGFRSGREIWRDSHTLFQSVTEKSERPKVLSWVDDLRQEGRINWAQVQLDVFGISSSTAKIFYWRHESLPLPLVYLEDANRVGALKGGILLAEKVARILKAATYAAVLQAKKDVLATEPEEATQALDFTGKNDSLKKKKPDPIGSRVKALTPERAYWSRLELRFRALLLRLSEATDADAHGRELGRWFHRELAPLVRQAFESVVNAMSGSQRELHGAAVGEHYLNRRLRKLGKRFPEPARPTTEDSRDD
jgi:CRISPR system Cascade subunit CasA